MKIVIVSSSHRKNSNSMRVSRYLENRLIEKNYAEETLTLDLAQIKLPLWDDCMWAKESNPLKEKWAPLAKELKEASGFVFVTPEWNGMAAPALQNFLLFCSQRELGHKPALITTVSTGIGGAYPINEVRSFGYKNTRVCYLPEHLIVRSANDFFDEAKQESEHTVHLKERIDMTLGVLQTYCKSFENLRSSLEFDFKKFPNGM